MNSKMQKLLLLATLYEGVSSFHAVSLHTSTAASKTSMITKRQLQRLHETRVDLVGLEQDTRASQLSSPPKANGSSSNPIELDPVRFPNICKVSTFHHALKWMPSFSVLAYLTFPDVQHAFSLLVETLYMNKNWQPVDGGNLRVDLILPAANGIVVPSISTLFAILTGQTTVSFRNRMLAVDESLQREMKEIEMLIRLVSSISNPTFVDNACRLILAYTSRVVEECETYDETPILSSTASCEIDSLFESIIVLGRNKEPKEGTAVDQMFTALSRLSDNRISRISALNATYPAAHYWILTILASAIMTAFLIETDKAPNLFLNEVQLKILWAFLVGTFTTVAKIIWDLSTPLEGSYRVKSWTQFEDFQERLITQANAALRAGRAKGQHELMP